MVIPFMEDIWNGFKRVDELGMSKPVQTAVDENLLNVVAKTISELPKDKKFLRKIERLVADRNKMYFETQKLDWAMGELLAYGTLLLEGFNVRLSGQDVERGTFSHRHAVIKAEASEEELILLNQINPEKQGKYMPGSRIPIYAEAFLKKDKPEYVLILPWNLKSELIKQLSYIKESGGKFVVAEPKLEII